VLYADFAGNLDSCIAIRTLLMKGKKAYLQAGAGIVADSDPQREFEETENKARAVLRAVEMARGNEATTGTGSRPTTTTSQLQSHRSSPATKR
jgi:anthranilate/para-aminobenzoate synthase component I